MFYIKEALLDMEYAPVLISVYDRITHLKNCLDSLRSDTISRHTDLYIVSDAAHAPSFESAIQSVREFIRTIQGFKKVITIERENNLGSFLSITSAIKMVLEDRGKVIFLEDDNIVSTNFLKFMNDGLEFYKNDPSVISISGYNFPIDMPKQYKHDVYKWQGFSAWGVGLWRDKWHEIDWSVEGIRGFLSNKTNVKRLNRIAEHVAPHLIQNVLKKNHMICDSIVSMNLVAHNKFSIFPVVTKVKNMGHDGSGEHGGLSDIYNKQILDNDGDYKLVRDFEPDPEIQRLLWRHFRMPLKYRIIGITPAPIKNMIKKVVTRP